MKNKAFLIFAILAAICIFAVAASCNLCGFSIGTPSGETGEFSGEEDDGLQADEESPASGTGETESQTHAAEDSSDDNGSDVEDADDGDDEGNHSPVITEILAEDEELDLSDEYDIPTGVTIDFIIQAEDQDGDELIYSVSDSEGNNMETVREDNNTALFGWVAPDDTGEYEIYIEVSDASGAEDTATVRVNVEPWEVVDEDEDEDEGEVGPPTSISSFGANTSISGNVAEDRSVFIAADSSGAPTVYAGDGSTGILIKGFLSFDVSRIAAKNVLGAWLNLRSSRVGNPPSLMGIFSVNFTNYGNALDGADWGRTSSSIFSSSLSNTDFSFSNEALKNAVQVALDEGRQYFQVKLSTQNANGNGAADGFTFILSDISLEVEYN